MSFYLIIGGLLVVLLGSLLVYRAASRKPPVAGGGGSARFSRANFEVRETRLNSRRQPVKPGHNFRILALMAGLAALLGWVGFSLAVRSPDQSGQSVANAKATPDAAEEDRLAPKLSGRLTGPPPEGPIPPGPIAPPPIPAPGDPAPAAQEPAGSFPPNAENLEAPSVIAAAALSLAPVISRMEAVGRSTSMNWGCAKPVASAAPPKKAKPSLPPPPLKRPESQPNQPKAASPPPSPINPRGYTVLLGAYVKMENALNLKNRLEAAGVPTSISEATEKNKLWYRVMSGHFDDKSTAEAYSRELRQRKLVERPYVKAL
jgi:cell division septation protein DedD